MDPLEKEPPEAELIFRDQIDLARAFTRNLAQFGEEKGLIGPLELPRLWTRHILNCAVIAPLIHGRVGDVGSGAGLPGIVLAIARPDATFFLIEPMARRTEWLKDQVQELGLTNVHVLRDRAENLSSELDLDQLTARAVSSLKKLIPITAPLVKPGGELILMKGQGAEAEIEAARKQIRQFHLENVEIVTLGEGLIDDVTRVVRATVNPEKR